MRVRVLGILLIATLALSACNLSLAEDLTPPPGYKSPAPVPTLGVLYPGDLPSLARGEVIYMDECASCHGDTGLGNGPLSAELPVPVPAIGLREISKQSTPADWYAIVTQGKADRSMPAFTSLDEQQRWDVVAYTFSLGTTPEELEQGESLFMQNCVTCHGEDGRKVAQVDLTDQEFMSRMTGTALYRVIAEGQDPMPAFEDKLVEDEIWALADYLRSRTFDPAPLAEPTLTPLPATETPAVAETPTEAPPATSLGTVSGKVIPPHVAFKLDELTLTLHGFDLGADGNPVETVTVDGKVGPDGAYAFENVEMLPGRFFLVEVTSGDVSLVSEPITIEDGMDRVTLPDVDVFETTDDLSTLVMEDLHMIVDVSESTNLVIYEIHLVTNPGEKAVRVVTDGTTLPFVDTPDGATPMGIQLTQDSAPLLGTSDGFVMPPGEDTYGFVTLYILPYSRKVEFSQSFALPVSKVSLLVPQGMKVRSEDLIRSEPQAFDTRVFEVYSGTIREGGTTLTVVISGKPKEDSTQGFTWSNQNRVVIGFAVLGLLLLGVGAFLFLRDRKLEKEEELVEEIEADSQTILDAIIALDDRFKAGELTREAYEQRRAELKDQLRERVDTP